MLVGCRGHCYDLKVITSLHLENVGPAPQLDLELAPRLNLLTGDNGLGKSFLLDVSWYVLTHWWPAEINPDLSSGLPAQPFRRNVSTTIQASFAKIPGTKSASKTKFQFDYRGWGSHGHINRSQTLVIYVQVDGSFAVWDRIRNQLLPDGDPQLPRAFVFSTKQLWHGLAAPKDPTRLWCRGLIADWATWQTSRDQTHFRALRAVLAALAPGQGETLEPGELTRLNVAEAIDFPTLRTSYGQEVPLPYLSSGIRRIVDLAYLLVWAWKEHQIACKVFGSQPVSKIVLLIDEIEAHLHPTWQRSILPAILAAMKTLTADGDHPGVDVQLLAVTHSPLVMASAEPLFDPAMDAWHDFDLVDLDGNRRVEITRRDWAKQGDASSWLTSKAFDLPSSRSREAEAAINEAGALIKKSDEKDPGSLKEEAQLVHQQLLQTLAETDPYLFRWRYIAKSKGWVE